MRECLSHMMEVGLARIEPRAVRTFGGHRQMDMRMIGICMERQHIGVIVLEQDPGERLGGVLQRLGIGRTAGHGEDQRQRSEEHTSELQSLMRISYAVFCLKKKNTHYSDDSQKQTIQPT